MGKIKEKGKKRSKKKSRNWQAKLVKRKSQKQQMKSRAKGIKQRIHEVKENTEELYPEESTEGRMGFSKSENTDKEEQRYFESC